MKMNDMYEAFEIFSKMIDLKNELHKKSDVCCKKDDEDDNDEDCDDNDKDSEKCPIAKEINDDYNSIMTWAFGENYSEGFRADYILLWQKFHATLELPRMLKTSEIDPLFSVAAIMIDIIPLYNKEKNIL